MTEDDRRIEKKKESQQKTRCSMISNVTMLNPTTYFNLFPRGELIAVFKYVPVGKLPLRYEHLMYGGHLWNLVQPLNFTCHSFKGPDTTSTPDILLFF